MCYVCNLKGENSANCVDNDGSFDCFCKKGYANNTEGLCVNKNECLIGRVSIPRPGQSGIWPRPWIPDLKIFKTLTGEHICDHNAHCIDEVGDYRCECNLGYAGNGYQCMNIHPRISVQGYPCMDIYARIPMQGYPCMDPHAWISMHG